MSDERLCLIYREWLQCTLGEKAVAAYNEIIDDPEPPHPWRTHVLEPHHAAARAVDSLWGKRVLGGAVSVSKRHAKKLWPDQDTAWTPYGLINMMLDVDKRRNGSQWWDVECFRREQRNAWERSAQDFLSTADPYWLQCDVRSGVSFDHMAAVGSGLDDFAANPTEMIRPWTKKKPDDVNGHLEHVHVVGEALNSRVRFGGGRDGKHTLCIFAPQFQQPDSLANDTDNDSMRRVVGRVEALGVHPTRIEKLVIVCREPTRSVGRKDYKMMASARMAERDLSGGEACDVATDAHAGGGAHALVLQARRQETSYISNRWGGVPVEIKEYSEDSTPESLRAKLGLDNVGLFIGCIDTEDFACECECCSGHAHARAGSVKCAHMERVGRQYTMFARLWKACSNSAVVTSHMRVPIHLTVRASAPLIVAAAEELCVSPWTLPAAGSQGNKVLHTAIWALPVPPLSLGTDVDQAAYEADSTQDNADGHNTIIESLGRACAGAFIDSRPESQTAVDNANAAASVATLAPCLKAAGVPETWHIAPIAAIRWQPFSGYPGGVLHILDGGKTPDETTEHLRNECWTPKLQTAELPVRGHQHKNQDADHANKVSAL